MTWISSTSTSSLDARYEHRIFHCLQIFDILTLALAPPRKDTLFGIVFQKICDLPGLPTFDLPQTVQRQVEQTKLRNTRLIMDAIYICNNRRTMFLWSNKTSTGKGDYYYWLLHWSPPPTLIWSAQHILLILGKRNEASRIYRFVDSRFWARINTFVDSSIWLFKEHKILSWFAPQLSLWPLLFYFFPPDNCALIL